MNFNRFMLAVVVAILMTVIFMTPVILVIAKLHYDARQDAIEDSR